MTVRGEAAYDQLFHRGVNIIRGANASGKSTISDFIFYVLGGEFDGWKEAASKCDQVQAEVETPLGVITIRRDIDKAQTKPSIFFGAMADADQHGLDQWQLLSMRRSDYRDSFAQTFFRAIGIPEAQSAAADNVTMHQVLRLLYADQRTPAGLLFHFESFDTREMREAVGDLVCGLSVYETYEAEVALKKANKEFDAKQAEYRNLVAGLPDNEPSYDPAAIEARIAAFDSERAQLETEVRTVDAHIDDRTQKAFSSERKTAVERLHKRRAILSDLEQAIESIEYDTSELDEFLPYLETLLENAALAESASEAIGHIEFTHCPACLAALKPPAGDHECGVCGEEIDEDKLKSKYLAIRTDLQVQIKESSQLRQEKAAELKDAKIRLRRARAEFNELQSDFAAKYELSDSPREAFLAERHRKIGHIEREREYLLSLTDRFLELARVSEEKAKIQAEIDEIKARLAALELRGKRRRAEALTVVSELVKSILMNDIPKEETFERPSSVTIDFGDNVVKVDGKMNFSESSNVILKNAAILSIFGAATRDPKFFHPRFLLMDNIEDKGMEPERSHRFQELIVKVSEEAELEHQVIFMTSMMNPELDDAQYTIGPSYTKTNKTLAL